MKKRNVYLVDLGTGTNMNMLPLATGLVGAYSLEQPELAAMYDFHFRFLRPKPLSSLVDTMPNPTVVGLSCYVWNINGTLEVARQLKMRHPNVIIVLGGYSQPKRQNRIGNFFRQNPQVDILVHGEGEMVFSDILYELLGSGDLSKIRGITFQEKDAEDGFVTTESADLIKDINILPSPFLNGVMDKLVTTYGNKITGVLWETNRGCPFTCTFCDWGDSSVSKLRIFNTARLKDEMAWIGKNEFHYVFATDANFGILRDRDEEIASIVVQSRKNTGFPKHFGVNWTKNSSKHIVSIADTFTSGGIQTEVTTSAQSYHEPTLKAIKRRNLRQDIMEEVKDAMRARGLPTQTELLLGLPLQTYESFKATLNRVMTHRSQDRFMIYPCVLLENSEMSTLESRKLYALESRTIRVASQNRTFASEEEAPEEIELVVGTSTMPTHSWEKAYEAGCLASALYNHKPAFFVLNFLRHHYHLEPMSFIEFTMEHVTQRQENFPSIWHGLAHIKKQKKMILDGIVDKSGLDGLENIALNPDVVACIYFVSDIDRFYEELQKLVSTYLQSLNFSCDAQVLNDLLEFNKQHMPTWPWKNLRTATFATNIPAFFESYLKGETPPKIVDAPSNIQFFDPFNRNIDDFRIFAATLVRAYAVDLFAPQVLNHENTGNRIKPSSANVTTNIERISSLVSNSCN